LEKRKRGELSAVVDRSVNKPNTVLAFLRLDMDRET